MCISEYINIKTGFGGNLCYLFNIHFPKPNRVGAMAGKDQLVFSTMISQKISSKQKKILSE